MSQRITDLNYVEDSFDESWNEIVSLLGEIFGVEVALINDVDGNQLEVLKKNEAPGNPFVENEIYDLTTVYCNKVVNDQERLEINNAAEDERWADYKGLEYGLMSYLGYPIFSSDGEVIGTICVESKEEKYFTETENNLLLKFKNIIEDQLKQLELTRELEDKTRELEENIEEGKKLHQQYLPSRLPEVADLHFGTYYQSAKQLGGDFYEAIKTGDNVLFYISDVSGHNLSSSMLNIFLKETIDSYLLFQKESTDFLSPSNILKHIQKRFREEDFTANYFICLVLGVIDLESFEIKLTNAGVQVSPIVTQKEGDFFPISCKGMPITVFEQEKEYEECSFFLQSGDTLHLNTDGLIEQTNSSGDFYGQERLKSKLISSADLKPEQMLGELYDDFFEFKKGMPIQDDLTSFVIQRNSNK